MSNATLTLAGQLAAARVLVMGGAPLSAAMLSQCLLEAMALEKLETPVRTGMADADVLASRTQTIGDQVRAELLQLRLEAGLTAGGESTATRL